MYVVTYYIGDALHDLAGDIGSVRNLVHLLEGSKVQFKVSMPGTYLLPKAFGWGWFEYWLHPDESFKSLEEFRRSRDTIPNFSEGVR